MSEDELDVLLDRITASGIPMHITDADKPTLVMIPFSMYEEMVRKTN